MKPPLFRWHYGRQRSGYRVLCLWSWLRCDCYLIHIPKGVPVAAHRDPVPGRRHFRLNLDLRGRCRMLAAHVLWRCWRITLFRPDLVTHQVLAPTRPVWMLSFGMALPDRT